MEDLSSCWVNANKAYEQGQYNQALKIYSQIALRSLCLEISPEQAKQKALDTFFNMYPNLPKDMDYFAAIRYWQDHYVENEERVQKAINKEIPPYYLEGELIPQEESSSYMARLVLPPYSVYIESSQGPRNEMEDVHFIRKLAIKRRNAHLFCVLDGHGGQGCALFSATVLPELLQGELADLSYFTDAEIYNAFVRTFIKLDEQWKALPMQLTAARDNSGTTATLACILNKKDLWVANVGDSGAILITPNGPVMLSETAKPNNPQYIEEIYSRGGFIAYNRVDGSLDMARSIGDLDHESVSSRPTIKKISAAQGRLVLSCDGLWDVVDPYTAAQAIKGMTAKKAAGVLRKLAYQRGSTDNVTVMVVDLKTSLPPKTRL